MTDVVTRSRVPVWSEVALRRLHDTSACPVCASGDVFGLQCRRCGADFRDGMGTELWDASQAAVAALEARQAVLDRVPLRPVPAMPAQAPAPQVRPASLRPAGSSATVQSVLAVAGAGLVAVAAIVFTFFNPDLTDTGVRNAITAVVTLVFLAGTRVLVARGLRFSAEAVGALGAVFVALVVVGVAGAAASAPWTDAAIAMLLAGAALATLGLVFRVRTWLFAGLVALPFVPVLFATGVGAAAPVDAAGGIAPVIGWFAAAVVASALIEACRRFGARTASPLTADLVTLTVVQIGANALAGLAALASGAGAGTSWLLCAVFAATAVLSAFSARHVAGGFWSFAAGGSGVLAFVVLPFAAVPNLDPGSWYLALVPVSGVLGLIVLAALMPLPGWIGRGFLTGGALTATALGAFLPTMQAGLSVVTTLFGRASAFDEFTAYDGVLPVAVGLAGLSAGLVAFSRLRAGAAALEAAPVTTDAAASTSEATAVAAVRPVGTRWVGDIGLWYAGLAGLALMSSPMLHFDVRVWIGLGLAVATAAAILALPLLRDARVGVRLPLLSAAHIAVVLAAVLSWQVGDLTVVAGAGAVVAIAVVGRAMPRRVRFLHVGAAYAYALVVFATALARAGVDPLPLVCLVTSAGAVVAVLATFVPVVGARAWQAVLVVTTVPFALGVLQVVSERSGWTALSTGLMFLLGLTLVVTRRPGLGRIVRALAAASLVPSLAVVVVCLGAQLLPGSGSPVVLPIIAVVAALVLPATTLVRDALAARIGDRDAALARLAIESSTLVTSAIAVGLALVREAAGLGTTLLVFVILGIGAIATGVTTRRRYAWWMAGAAFTGALWCVWGMQGVDAVEPYLLPPALAAALVGAILVARGRRGLPLYATGLALAVATVLVLLALEGGLVRGGALLAASWALVALGWAYGSLTGRLRRTGSAWRHAWRLRALRPATYAVALGAGAAGAVLGVRLGLGLDAASDPLVLVCLGVGLLGALPAALAARGLRAAVLPASRMARSRWLLAPALAFPGIAAWTAIERDWFAIWTMWGLLLAYLVVVVATSARVRRGATVLPPVWFAFALAFTTAVVAWSPRDLRVEWFSLPLGLFLLIAGALHLKRDAAASGDAAPAVRRTLSSWPGGWAGSRALLGPGLVVMLSASIAATFTDPQTWRAILVIALALLAILVGASLRLAAPFLLGIIVLPIENVIAFVVQIGRGIESMPWWITLAIVGAVLLIIAVTYERRAGEEKGVVARLRDLA